MNYEEILLNYAKYFQQSDVVESAIRTVGWKLILLLRGICDACQSVWEAVFRVLSFTQVISEKLGTYYPIWNAIFLVTILAVGTVFLYSERRPPFLKNLIITMAVVMLLPAEGTLQNYITSFTRMTYPRTLATTFAYVISLTLIQIFICSMAGDGFARYEFPFKQVLFGCVILTIVIPNDTLMLPLYTQFRNFDIFGIIHLVTGHGINLLSTEVPMYIMTALGCGLRSGLYIYIFNQFFRGLPKEIEEAAVVDGAGSFYTYFRIMLVNAMPSVLTVSIFSLVWQYNDTFYAKLFSINSKLLMSMRISTLRASIEFIDQIKDTAVSQLYLYAGIVLMVIPIVIIYILLQKRFIEGASRSGIVG